jgi:hypothetical protein
MDFHSFQHKIPRAQVILYFNLMHGFIKVCVCVCVCVLLFFTIFFHVAEVVTINIKTFQILSIISIIPITDNW